MVGEQLVNVTHRGLEVGSSLKLSEFGPTTAQLELSAPLPVGTPIDVTSDSGIVVAARVLRVTEQVAGAETVPGMRIGVSDLSGDAKSWWDALVSVEDPTIPEPAKLVENPLPAEPAAEPEATPAEATAADDVGSDFDAAETVQTPSPDDVPTAKLEDPDDVTTEPVKGKKKKPSRTMVMSTDEIQQAIAAGGQDLDGVPGPIEATLTDPMPAADIQAITKDEPPAEQAAEPKKKKKKRRGRRKKKD